MHKFNKKTILIIIIIIISILIAIKILIKPNELIENISELESEITEENNQSEKAEKQETEEKIIIYITGAVKNEGVYEIKENSRIADAIETAGGLKENADIEDINLAYVLEDGIKIYIPTKEEKNKNTTQEKQTTEYTSKSSSTTEQTQNNQASTTNANKNINNTTNKNEKVNINTATQTELETLPGIGPSTALKIINYRKENGKFKTIDDVKKVSGIGDSKFDKIKNFIKV